MRVLEMRDKVRKSWPFFIVVITLKAFTFVSVVSGVAPDLYLGCYQDQSNRDLVEMLGPFDTNTPETCISRCYLKGYMFAGLQATNWCHCWDSFGKYGKIPDSECNSTCTGNSNLKCGGDWRNAVYRVVPTLKNYIGCYLEGEPRDLWGYQSQLSRNVTSFAECRSVCASKGFHFAAVYNYSLCSCGIKYGRYGLDTSGRKCLPVCTVGAMEDCTTAKANSIFRTMRADLYLGCFLDTVDRDLPTSPGGPWFDLTPHTCAARCRALGDYTYSGLQANSWCNCGHSYGKHGKVSDSECNGACTGDATIMCGGGFRNSVYKMESDIKLPTPPSTFMYRSPKGQFPLDPHHVIYTETAVSQTECVLYCELSPACMSINYDAANKVCEMNNVTRSAGSSNVRNKFVYLERQSIGSIWYH